jgi:hypothetical protein
MKRITLALSCVLLCSTSFYANAEDLLLDYQCVVTEQTILANEEGVPRLYKSFTDDVKTGEKVSLTVKMILRKWEQYQYYYFMELKRQNGVVLMNDSIEAEKLKASKYRDGRVFLVSASHKTGGNNFSFSKVRFIYRGEGRMLLLEAANPANPHGIVSKPNIMNGIIYGFSLSCNPAQLSVASAFEVLSKMSGE